MKYEIWAEGYSNHESEYATAELIDIVEANSFLDACWISLKDESTYDIKTNTLWGCRLFDNEIDARKSFG